MRSVAESYSNVAVTVTFFHTRYGCHWAGILITISLLFNRSSARRPSSGCLLQNSPCTSLDSSSTRGTASTPHPCSPYAVPLRGRRSCRSGRSCRKVNACLDFQSYDALKKIRTENKDTTFEVPDFIVGSSQISISEYQVRKSPTVFTHRKEQENGKSRPEHCRGRLKSEWEM